MDVEHHRCRLEAEGALVRPITAPPPNGSQPPIARQPTGARRVGPAVAYARANRRAEVRPAGSQQRAPRPLADRVSLNPRKANDSGDGSGSMMNAIVQVRYGSPDVLHLKDIDKPVVRDGGVLVRVHAAAVNIGDWHLLRGVPYVVRLASGLRKPRREIPGLDIAGQVEAVGGIVEQFRPGDEVFGWCKGAFAEYACVSENNLLPKPANLTLEQSAAVGDSAFTALAAVRD